MRTIERDPCIGTGAFWGAACAVMLALFVWVPSARADGDGRLYLTRDGKPIDLLAERIDCTQSMRPMMFDRASNA